jgi:peptidyl-prolyl cis-trans isomerase C
MALYVNGELIEESEIQEEVERLRPAYIEKIAEGEMTSEHEIQIREWSRENVIERALMTQAAVRETSPVPPDVLEHAFESLIDHHGGKEEFYKEMGATSEQIPEIKRDIERRMRVEQMMENIIQSAPAPSKEIMLEFYDNNTERFAIPDSLRASHIVKQPTPEMNEEAVVAEMGKVLEELKNGADFTELASKHSDCADSDGDLGFFPRGQMVPAFEEVVFNMEAGEVSDVFRTEFGYHIAKVVEKHPSRICPFDEAKETIARMMSQQKAVEGFVDGEKQKAVIEER